MKRGIKSLLLLLVVLITLGFLTACSNKAGKEKFNSIYDLDGKKISTSAYTADNDALKQTLPNAELIYLSTVADSLQALKDGKTDAMFTDETICMALVNEVDGLTTLGSPITNNEIAAIFQKGEDKLRNEFNEFVDKCKCDSTLDRLYSKWFDFSNTSKDTSFLNQEKTGKTINVCVNSDNVPLTYIQNGESVGYEIELVYLFAKEYGYYINIIETNFDGVLAAVASKKADMGMASLFVTEERKQTVDFSTSYYSSGSTFIVKKERVGTYNNINTIDDLKGKTISILSGSTYDTITSNYFDDDIKINYYNSSTDGLSALRQGKVDAYVTDEPELQYICNVYSDVEMLSGCIQNVDYATVFPKKSKYLNEFNQFIDEITKDGRLNRINEYWITNSNIESKYLDFESLENINGVINLGICSSIGAPFTYYYKGSPTGYELEIIYEYAKEKGYAIEIYDTDPTGVIAGTETNKYDMGIALFAITEERKKSVDFSDVYYRGSIAVLVKSKGSSDTAEYSSYEDLENKRIGYHAGAISYMQFVDKIENVECQEYNMLSDLPVALESGKIDAYALDSPVAQVFLNKYKNQTIINLDYESFYNAYIFRKNDPEESKLCDELNAFINTCKVDGSLQKIKDLWLSTDTEKQVVDLDSLEDINGTITLACTSTTGEPFVYVKDGKYVGFDVDFIARFAKKYGYRVEIMDTTFSGVLAAVSSGKADIGGSCITITEERKESMLFSEPYYETNIVLVCNKKDCSEESSSSNIIESFNKTFIKEDRYKLFLEGIGSTLLITLSSVILGTIIGFLIFVLGKDGNKFINFFMRFFCWLVQRCPMVVLLMVLFYIVFGKSSINAITVSIIAFTIIFTVSVYSILKTAIGAIDKGQYEASLALGYTKNQAFFKIIVPEALSLILPNYKGEIVSLLKSTSIVGYISVQDLTKMSDIVRSRTYEAFFPLIVTAIIYFILADLLLIAVKGIEINTDPKLRNKDKILRGIKR